MLEKRRDIDKFFYIFEVVTDIPLNSDKLTKIQEYLCQSGYALCRGPLDFVITDKVTLQLFIDAIESRGAFSLGNRTVSCTQRDYP